MQRKRKNDLEMDEYDDEKNADKCRAKEEAEGRRRRKTDAGTEEGPTLGRRKVKGRGGHRGARASLKKKRNKEPARRS